MQKCFDHFGFELVLKIVHIICEYARVFFFLIKYFISLCTVKMNRTISIYENNNVNLPLLCVNRGTVQTSVNFLYQGGTK